MIRRHYNDGRSENEIAAKVVMRGSMRQWEGIAAHPGHNTTISLLRRRDLADYGAFGVTQDQDREAVHVVQVVGGQ
jgi:hypothetical protein